MDCERGESWDRGVVLVHAQRHNFALRKKLKCGRLVLV